VDEEGGGRYHEKMAARRSSSSVTAGSFVLVASTLTTMAGCSSHPATADQADAADFYDCTTEPRAVAAIPGLVVGAPGGFSATLESLQPTVIKKYANTWQVRLRDAAGTALPGASVKAVPFMPDHGHGTTVKVTVQDLGDGSYVLTPIYFFMAGYWEVTVTAVSADRQSDGTMMFPVCVPG
jgi:hypothetical protein